MSNLVMPEILASIRDIANDTRIPLEQRMLQMTAMTVITSRNPQKKVFVGSGTGINTGIKMSLAPSGKSIVLESIWDERKNTILPHFLGTSGGERSTYVPLMWLTERGFNAMINQVAIIKTVLPEEKEEVFFPVKALVVWSTSKLRELYTKAYLDRWLMFYVNYDERLGINLAEYDISQNLGPVRPEQATKGLRGVRFPTNKRSHCSYYDGVNVGLWLFEAENKFNERFTKIYGNTDGISLGAWDNIVMLDKPVVEGKAKYQKEVDKAFVSGTAYCTGMWRFIGGMRGVGRSLGKKFTIGSPSLFRGGDVNEMDFVSNLSVDKGGLNMLLSHTGVVDRATQVKFCVDNPDMTDEQLTEWAMGKLRDAGMIQVITTYYRGNKVTFNAVKCKEEMYATNIYVLYGKQYAADLKTLDGEDDQDGYDEAQQMSTSYYLDSQEWIKEVVSRGEQSTMSLPGRVHDDLEAKVIVHKNPITSVSVRDMTNILFSYCITEKDGKFDVDRKMLFHAMKQTVMDNHKNASKTHRAMHKMVNEGAKDLPHINKDVLEELVRDIFTITESVAVPGFIDEMEDTVHHIYVDTKCWSRASARYTKFSEEQFVERWNKLIKGYDTSAGYWPGLKTGMVISIEGYDFLIPPLDFMKSSLMPIDKDTTDMETNPEYMFSGAMETIFMLLGAISTDQAKKRASKDATTNWSFNAAQHLVRMNAAMFEDRLNRMMVKGGYFTIAPLFWKVDEAGYSHQVVAVAAKKGHMSYSKEPVIFDKGITGVMNSHDLPEDVFGKLSKVDMFALRSICFVNTDLLISQENDSDGDMCCIRFNIQLPLYTSQFRFMSNRVDTYVQGELKYAMKFKRWKLSDLHALKLGIHGNKTAKENIGLMSASMYQHAMLLEQAVTAGSMDPFWAKILWNLYGYIVQDEAMRQVKSTTSSSDSAQSHFFHSTAISRVFKSRTPVSDMLYGLPDRDIRDKPDDETRYDGFLDKLPIYWKDFDAKVYEGPLKEAIAAYVSHCRKWVEITYNPANYPTKNGKAKTVYPVGGQTTGRITGMGKRVESIQMALHIQSKTAGVHTGYKWFNVLQRGYFTHLEESRPGPARANNARRVLEANGVRVTDGASVFFGRMHLEEVMIPAIDVFSLAYEVDGKVQQGWRSQHLYAGKNFAKALKKDGSIVWQWMYMIHLSHAANVESRSTPEEKEQKRLEAEFNAADRVYTPEEILKEMSVIRPVVFPDASKH